MAMRRVEGVPVGPRHAHTQPATRNPCPPPWPTGRLPGMKVARPCPFLARGPRRILIPGLPCISLRICSATTVRPHAREYVWSIILPCLARGLRGKPRNTSTLGLRAMGCRGSPNSPRPIQMKCPKASLLRDGRGVGTKTAASPQLKQARSRPRRGQAVT